MADYYMSYSAEIKGLTEEESKWAHSRIKEIEDAGDEDAGDEDAVCGLGEIEVVDGVLWFHGEEYGDPGAVAEFAWEFLKRFRPRDSFALEYAHTCSSPRLDGFGGGAVFVTAEGIECVETAAWVAERRREHEIRRGGADAKRASRQHTPGSEGTTE
jgi:hypothetical protein